MRFTLKYLGSVVAHCNNPSSWETEALESPISGLSGLCSKILSLDDGCFRAEHFSGVRKALLELQYPKEREKRGWCEAETRCAV